MTYGLISLGRWGFSINETARWKLPVFSYLMPLWLYVAFYMPILRICFKVYWGVNSYGGERIYQPLNVKVGKLK